MWNVQNSAIYAFFVGKSAIFSNFYALVSLFLNIFAYHFNLRLYNYSFMAAKKTRLDTLSQLLQTNSFESQEQVLQALRDAGYSVAQPTLSRDLRTLKVSKVCTENGGYAYALPSQSAPSPKVEEMRRPLLPHTYAFKSVDFSGNLAVIKTLSGYASGLSAEIDNQHVKEIVGTVAGDDTIIAVLREGTSKTVIINMLKAIMPNYGE